MRCSRTWRPCRMPAISSALMIRGWLWALGGHSGSTFASDSSRTNLIGSSKTTREGTWGNAQPVTANAKLQIKNANTPSFTILHFTFFILNRPSLGDGDGHLHPFKRIISPVTLGVHDGVRHVYPAHDLAERGVLPIQEIRIGDTDEKL